MGKLKKVVDEIYEKYQKVVEKEKKIKKVVEKTKEWLGDIDVHVQFDAAKEVAVAYAKIRIENSSESTKLREIAEWLLKTDKIYDIYLLISTEKIEDIDGSVENVKKAATDINLDYSGFVKKAATDINLDYSGFKKKGDWYVDYFLLQLNDNDEVYIYLVIENYS